MDNIQTSVRLIIFSLAISLLAVPYRSYCQNSIAKEIASNLYDVHDDSLRSYLKGNAIFIIVTNKNCIKCFTQACQYISTKYSTDYKVYSIILMPRNYLELIQTAQHYRQEIPCVIDFYFYFTTAGQKEEIENIATSPSPQMIIKNGDNYSYLSYGEVMQVVK